MGHFKICRERNWFVLILWLLGFTADHSWGFIPKRDSVYDAEEIIWFDVAGSNIVAYCGDGYLRVWNLNLGDPLATHDLRFLELYHHEQHLAVSKSSPGRIVISAAKKHGSERVPGMSEIRVMDLITGHPFWAAEVKGWTADVSFGAAQDVMALNLSEVQRWDAETGKQLPGGQAPSYGVPQIVANNGNIYLASIGNDQVVVADLQGRFFWRKPVPAPLLRKLRLPGMLGAFVNRHTEGTSFTSIYQSAGFPFPYVVVKESRDTSASFVAYSPQAGKVIWRLPSCDPDAVVAVSASGRKQAWFENKQLRILSLPSKEMTESLALEGEVDLRFLNDEVLVSIPAITKVSEDPEKQIIVWRRPSRLITFIDTQSGKVRHQRKLMFTPRVGKIEKH
jgi:outer membrane protein assembly factor BamB